MKIANVVSVQDKGSLGSNSTLESRVTEPSVPRMSETLRRYPTISDEERRQLIRFLKNGSQEDIARAVYEVGLEQRLTAFRMDHPEHFPTGVKVWAPLALLVLIPLLGVLWRMFA